MSKISKIKLPNGTTYDINDDTKVSKVSTTSSSDRVYGIESDGSQTTFNVQAVSLLNIDSTPTSSSTNLVTSGGVASAISGKQDTSTLETDVAAKGFTKNTGTVTSVAVEMNGSTKGTVTSSGTIDLGTVITSHQDISGKENTSNKVTTLSSSSTNTQYPSAKVVYDGLATKLNTSDVVEAGTIETADVTLLTIDSTVTSGSSNLVTSGAVSTAVSGKLDKVSTSASSARVYGVSTSGSQTMIDVDDMTIDSTPTSGSTNLVTSGGVYSAIHSGGVSLYRHTVSYRGTNDEGTTGFDIIFISTSATATTISTYSTSTAWNNWLSSIISCVYFAVGPNYGGGPNWRYGYPIIGGYVCGSDGDPYGSGTCYAVGVISDIIMGDVSFQDTVTQIS